MSRSILFVLPTFHRLADNLDFGDKFVGERANRVLQHERDGQLSTHPNYHHTFQVETKG